MKRILMIILFALVLLTGCESEENMGVINSESKKEELDIEINLSAEDVVERISFIPTISDIVVVDAKDHSGLTETLDECTVLVYFSSTLVDQSDFSDKSTEDKGTACGGSIEIFESEKSAQERDEYLGGTFISMMSPGTHAVSGKIVVRISKEMTEEQQQEFEELVFAVLTTTDANELLEIKKFVFSGYAQEDEVELNAEEENKDEEENIENTIKMPESAYLLEDMNCEDVINILKEAGFNNIKTKAIYNLDTDFWDSLSHNKVGKVEADGNDDFSEGQIFDENVSIVISFYDYEKDNPSIEFKSYSFDELMKDLEDNPMRAERNHENEYVQVTGKVSSISKQGTHILMHDVKGKYALDTIFCGMTTDELEEKIIELSVGDEVTIRGKIKTIDVMYPYSIDVYSFR